MTVTEIKTLIYNRVEIVPFLSKFIKLKRQGVDYFGLCPFHNEKSPSFSVSPKKEFYKCFGCGASGDVITFIMQHEKLGFIDALKEISKLESLSIDFEPEKRQNSSLTKSNPLEHIKFVPKEILVKTLAFYDHNPFYLWLERMVGKERATIAVADQYYVGTAKDQGTIFWQVDQFMRIRTGQRIFYKEDGHRKKEIPPKRLYTQANNYKPCFFGEHQLLTADKDTLIGVVESEKTAVICSLYLPYLNDRKVIWLGAGGMNGLTEEKMWVLRGLDVVLAPDFGFLSRMVWGKLPMRKRVDPTDNQMKPHPEGELDEQYVSIAMKFQKLNCNVLFYDPIPESESKEDIADELIKHECPPTVKLPDFEELTLQTGF